MSFHPNDIARRARLGSIGLGIIFSVLAVAFFRAQILEHDRYKLQSQENRLRPIPLPAPRGIIYDRKGQVIAENLPGYQVSLIAPNVDSLRVALDQLGTVINLTDRQKEAVIRRFRRDRNRPAVIMSDASIDVISVLEEHRLNFPRLLIQSVPKRYYPDGDVVASFVGYTGEITEDQLASDEFASYKPGQIIGKGGLEREYESVLHGQEGVRYDEVDARGRIIRRVMDRPDLMPEAPPPLYTNIDMDLQRHIAKVFGDSLQGGVVALHPKTGAVLALYSAPSYDPNRFTGGIPQSYWDELREDPRRPLFNKALQGTYPPGSVYKLVTAITALEAGMVTMDERMPVPCRGGYQMGNRYFRCWKRDGHGDVNLTRAIEVSCDTYFYQLGLKMGLSRMIAGGIRMGSRRRTNIDLPGEYRSLFPDGIEYFNKRYGPRGWTTGATILNLSIGQGENSQTVVNMAKFYTALANNGQAATPHVARQKPEHETLFSLPPEQMQGILEALTGVVSVGGTAAGSRIEGIVIAGKTGTAQHHGPGPDHGWFVGFAPAEDPQIVVSVMLEFGGGGSRAARIASSIIGHYLKSTPAKLAETGG